MHLKYQIAKNNKTAITAMVKMIVNIIKMNVKGIYVIRKKNYWWITKRKKTK